MSGNNLTRAEAAERARLLTVGSYDVALDLTVAETEFASTSVVRFACSEPGATTFVDLIAASIGSIELNGVPLDPGSVVEGNRITLAGLAADNELRVEAECRLHAAPVRACTASSTRSTTSVYLYTQFETGRRPARLRLLRPARPQGDVRVRRHRAGGLAGRLQRARAATPSRSGTAARSPRFATTPRMSTYITALVAGPYHVVRDH